MLALLRPHNAAPFSHPPNSGWRPSKQYDPVLKHDNPALERSTLLYSAFTSSPGQRAFSTAEPAHSKFPLREDKSDLGPVDQRYDCVCGA